MRSGGNVYSHWVTDRTQGGKGGGHHMKDVLQGRIKGVISRKLLLSFLLHLRICSVKVSTNRWSRTKLAQLESMLLC